jgi:hypothetical protein
VIRVHDELDVDVGEVVQLWQAQLQVAGRDTVADREELLQLVPRPGVPQPGAVGLEGVERDVGRLCLGGRPVDLEGGLLIGEGNYPQHSDSVSGRLSHRD